ncbi:septum formation initiator [Haloechinothrix salitolerans]|uniref:Septum formation initiator n=1 Tax=Haloechinothrix salitolerans TaxID=926830 RepID=A0ABW2C077_9PSEU
MTTASRTATAARADTEASQARASTATRTRTGQRTTRRSPRRSARPSPERSPERSPQRSTPHGPERGRSSAARKAYARRAQRTAAVDHVESGTAAAGMGALLALRLPKSRASFVLLMMVLLATGVIMTLWLSTQAIADSYRLERMRAETAYLEERAEQLQRDVARQESPAELAEKARELGMVPSGNPARIVVSEDGKPKVVGDPRPAGG